MVEVILPTPLPPNLAKISLYAYGNKFVNVFLIASM